MSDSKITDEIRVLPKQFHDLQDKVEKTESRISTIGEIIARVETNQNNTEKSISKLCDTIDKWKDAMESRVEKLRDDSLLQRGGFTFLSKTLTIIAATAGLIISLIGLFK